MVFLMSEIKNNRRMLLDDKLTLYTDHKSLTFRTISISCVMRWRNYMNDFDMDSRHIVGEDNKLAEVSLDFIS